MNSEFKAPKTIYLQVEYLSNLYGCTWSEDKINDTDVEYTRTPNQDNIDDGWENVFNLIKWHPAIQITESSALEDIKREALKFNKPKNVEIDRNKLIKMLHDLEDNGVWIINKDEDKIADAVITHLTEQGVVNNEG